jgi:hypothetical protein
MKDGSLHGFHPSWSLLKFIDSCSCSFLYVTHSLPAVERINGFIVKP